MNLRFLEEPDTIDFIGISLQIFAWFIAIPFILYNFHSLYQKYGKDDMAKSIISQREISLLITLNIVCILELLINRPFILSTTVWFAISSPPWFIVFVYCMFWIAMLMLYALRTWKLHYKQQLHIANSKQVWEQTINSNKKANWYIQNQHKYHNDNGILFRMLFPNYIIFICVGPILQFFVEPDSHHTYNLFVHFFNFIWVFIPLIIGLIIYYKSRNVSDIYGIRDEFKLYTIVIWIILFAYITEFPLFFSGILIKDKQDIFETIMMIRIEYILYSINAIILNCVLSLTSTIYPLRLIKQIKIGKKSHHQAVCKKNMTLRSIELAEHSAVPLFDILANEMRFKLFMQHLIKEFATESLLFITELTQCKFIYSNIFNHHQDYVKLSSSTILREFIRNHHAEGIYADFGEDMIIETDRIRVTLPSTLIISDILVNDSGCFRDLKMKEMTQEIYHKYIGQDSLYRISLSEEMKERLMAIFTSDNNDKDVQLENRRETGLLNVFDEAAVDMISILQESSHRFFEGGGATDILQ